MPSIKKTKRVLGAKVKVTKADAKKVKPLTNYLAGRLKESKYSNDDVVRMQGFVIGVSVVLIACFVALGIVKAL